MLLWLQSRLAASLCCHDAPCTRAPHRMLKGLPRKGVSVPTIVAQLLAVHAALVSAEAMPPVPSSLMPKSMAHEPQSMLGVRQS